MTTQIITSVDKFVVSALKDELYQLIGTAKDISVDSSFEKIRKSQNSLYEARGLHKALSKLDLVNDFAVTREDIERIEHKQLSVLEEKRRKDRLWKH